MKPHKSGPPSRLGANVRADRLQLLTENLGKAVAIGGELAVIQQRHRMEDCPRDPARMTRMIRLHTEGSGRLRLLLDGQPLTVDDVENIVWALLQRLRPAAVGANLLDIAEDIMEFLGGPPAEERMLEILKGAASGAEVRS